MAHRIDTPSAQKDKFGAGKNGFTRGNPQTGEQATALDDDYFDMLQEELVGIVESAGIALDKAKHDQILTALKKLFLSRANPFGDIKADGATAIAKALENLGLGVNRLALDADETSLVSPGKKITIFAKNDKTWGAWDVELQKTIPLSLRYGGLGATTKDGAWGTLGLTAGLPAIGVPFFWPSAAMPNTVIDEWSDMVFLKFNGATFSASTYPKLALVFPGLLLPEARGEFPRIWDDGRGVDTGRALLSAQGDAIRNMVGTIFGLAHGSAYGGSTGVFSGTADGVNGSGSASGGVTHNVNFSAANGGVPTASENRPRNIAFNFLVRAK